jgi:hypothetical protein
MQSSPSTSQRYHREQKQMQTDQYSFKTEVDYINQRYSLYLVIRIIPKFFIHFMLLFIFVVSEEKKIARNIEKEKLFKWLAEIYKEEEVEKK